MSSKRNASTSSNIDRKRPNKRYRQHQTILPALPEEIWQHIATYSPDAETWLNLALAVPEVGRWSMSDKGLAVSNDLFSTVETSDPSYRTKCVKFFKNGKLHRDGDKPAVVWEWQEHETHFGPNKRMVQFYKNGLTYRDGDFPTCVEFFKDNEADVSWSVSGLRYTKEFTDRNENIVRTLTRDLSKGPEIVLLSKDRLFMDFYKNNERVSNDESQPCCVSYSRLEKKKTSEYREVNGLPYLEIIDTESEYDVDAIMRELTKDVTTHGEDFIFHWNS